MRRDLAAVIAALSMVEASAIVELARKQTVFHKHLNESGIDSVSSGLLVSTRIQLFS